MIEYPTVGVKVSSKGHSVTISVNVKVLPLSTLVFLQARPLRVIKYTSGLGFSSAIASSRLPTTWAFACINAFTACSAMDLAISSVLGSEVVTGGASGVTLEKPRVPP